MVVRQMKIIRAVEFTFLFVAIPFIVFHQRVVLADYLLCVLTGLACLCAWLLYKEGKLEKQWYKAKSISLVDLKPILACFGLLVVSALFVMYFWPQLLSFNTTLVMGTSGILVFLLYPLFSVLPQEIIYRTFLFHRYKLLFPSKYARMFLSSLVFSLAHIIYGSLLVLVLSLLVGLLFSYRYFISGNTALVIIEHSMWGSFLFLLNLGSNFTLSQAL